MGKIKSFFIGASLGTIAALLLAPKTGEQTRALVAEKATAVAGEAKDFSADVPGSVQDAVKTIQDKGSEFVKSTAGQAPAPAQPDDDLREKIEAARKRIAAQVMENAEASKAVDVAAGEAAE